MVIDLEHRGLRITNEDDIRKLIDDYFTLAELNKMATISICGTEYPIYRRADIDDDGA